jgi:hypothetical protein
MTDCSFSVVVRPSLALHRWRGPLCLGCKLFLHVISTQVIKYAVFMRVSMTRVPKPAAPLIATSVRFDPRVKAAIDKAAEADARSASGLIQKVMTDWLKLNGFLK